MATAAIGDVPVESTNKTSVRARAHSLARPLAREEITRFLHGGRSPSASTRTPFAKAIISFQIYICPGGRVIVLDNGNARCAYYNGAGRIARFVVRALSVDTIYMIGYLRAATPTILPITSSNWIRRDTVTTRTLRNPAVARLLARSGRSERNAHRSFTRVFVIARVRADARLYESHFRPRFIFTMLVLSAGRAARRSRSHVDSDIFSGLNQMFVSQPRAPPPLLFTSHYRERIDSFRILVRGDCRRFNKRSLPFLRHARTIRDSLAERASFSHVSRLTDCTRGVNIERRIYL